MNAVRYKTANEYRADIARIDKILAKPTKKRSERRLLREADERNVALNADHRKAMDKQAQELGERAGKLAAEKYKELEKERDQALSRFKEVDKRHLHTCTVLTTERASWREREADLKQRINELEEHLARQNDHVCSLRSEIERVGSVSLDAEMADNAALREQVAVLLGELEEQRAEQRRCVEAIEAAQELHGEEIPF